MRPFILFLFSVLLLADASYAQKSMMAGKVVNEDNVPVPGARIEIKRNGDIAEAKTDGDGLFYSKLLPVGNYRISVVIGDKRMKAKSVYLPDETRKRSYYYLRVVGEKVVVTIDAEDPFLKAKLTKIEHDKYNIIMDGNIAIIKTDTATGRVKSIISARELPMRVKDAH